ncbi:hypothetical protein AB4120_15040 [Cupriavidus sp. 2KB_3]|uniref:hypothetical protein n=1 Tax=Cupriavidus sp. 2KB_3 TaxID=3232980 RepID=UPI003F8EFFF2
MSKLIETSAWVCIETDTGYVSQEEFPPCKDDPAEPLLLALDEIVRVLTVAGRHEEALRKAQQAASRTLVCLGSPDRTATEGSKNGGNGK